MHSGIGVSSLFTLPLWRELGAYFLEYYINDYIFLMGGGLAKIALHLGRAQVSSPRILNITTVPTFSIESVRMMMMF